LGVDGGIKLECITVKLDVVALWIGFVWFRREVKVKPSRYRPGVAQRVPIS